MALKWTDKSNYIYSRYDSRVFFVVLVVVFWGEKKNHQDRIGSNFAHTFSLVDGICVFSSFLNSLTYSLQSKATSCTVRDVPTKRSLQ